MKFKKSLLFIVAITTLFVLVYVATGCQSSSKSNGKIEAPTLNVIGNTMYWEPIDNALSYDIYCNDILLTNTTNCYYITDDLECTTQFYVITKSPKGSDKDSQPSDKVAISKQTGYSAAETMNLNLSSGNVTIPANINYVIVSGSLDNTSLLIASRTEDIKIELNNVTWTSSEKYSCITTADRTFDLEKNKFSATIVVNGTNVLTGHDYLSTPAQPATNSGQNGSKGGEGGSGIVLPKVAITGSGSLTLVGGKGGPGGKGADSSGFSTAVYGNGGDGGNGGSGIKCSLVILSMASTGIVKAYGSTGGSGGYPGNNGSILTGPLYTSSYKEHYGNAGESGQSLVGEIKQFGGTYMF